MSQPFSRVSRLIQILEHADAKTAIEYISPKKTIRVTRRSKLTRRKNVRLELHVSIGKPNYAERQYIKERVKVGAPFPAIKVKGYPRKR